MSWRICAVVALLSIAPVCANGEAAVALGIVYDTSGSMKESVQDASRKRSPKYLVANRALEAVIDRLAAFQAKGSAAEPKTIQAGLFIFDGNGAREAVKFGAFDAEALRNWARSFNRPNGPTPLGAAVQAAGRAVLTSNANARHLLVITDGINTAGPDPASVIAALNKEGEQKNRTVFFHFIAFDVSATVFGSVKREGATLVGAADEQQLKSQLEFILEEKILLEKEEPKR